MTKSTSQYYWFPWHAGTGTLSKMSDSEVLRRLDSILYLKPELEHWTRLECWQPVKDQEWADEFIEGWLLIAGEHNKKEMRNKFIEEYPKLEKYLCDSKFELNLYYWYK